MALITSVSQAGGGTGRFWEASIVWDSAVSWIERVAWMVVSAIVKVLVACQHRSAPKTGLRFPERTGGVTKEDFKKPAPFLPQSFPFCVHSSQENPSSPVGWDLRCHQGPHHEDFLYAKKPKTIPLSQPNTNLFRRGISFLGVIP